MSFRKILIPIDGTPVSRWALTRTEGLLQRPGSSVKILGVVPATREQAVDPLYAADPRHKPLHDTLGAIKAAYEKRRLDVDAEIRFGAPAIEILREAATGGHDLIAMATHGRSGIDRILFGSVTLKVLQSCPIPMLLFRPLLRLDETVSPAEPDTPAAFSDVLVPLDGSHVAEEIVPAVETLARTCGSRLHLLTVVPGGPDEARHRQTALHDLERWRRIFATLKIETAIDVRAGEPATEVLDCVRERGLDAVALTTHGRSGIARAIYGSVAEKVLTRATVPVLVLKSRITCPHPLELMGTTLRLEVP